jgi:hypothetical protein
MDDTCKREKKIIERAIIGKTKKKAEVGKIFIITNMFVKERRHERKLKQEEKEKRKHIWLLPRAFCLFL